MLTLITPTRGRPECFRLLETYIAAQTYTGEVQWVVVTDGPMDGYAFTRGQDVIVRSAANDPSHLPSICGNYLAALPHVRGDKILPIEDDDWYAPNYLDVMARELDTCPLVGSAPARYYNVQSGRWRLLGNTDHCSLAQTGFTAEVVETFKLGCRLPDNPFIDMFLWAHWPNTLGRPSRIIDNSGLHVGLKGLWGTPGIGTGHDPVRGHPDPVRAVLRAWIGDAWTNYYEEE